MMFPITISKSFNLEKETKKLHQNTIPVSDNFLESETMRNKEEILETLEDQPLKEDIQNTEYESLVEFLQTTDNIHIGVSPNGDNIIKIGESMFILDDIETNDTQAVIEYDGHKYYNISWLKQNYEHALPSYEEWETAKQIAGGIEKLLSLTHSGEPGFLTKDKKIYAGGFTYQAAQGEDVYGEHIANWSGGSYSGHIAIRDYNYIGCRRMYRGDITTIDRKKVTPDNIVGYIGKGNYIGLWYKTEDYVSEVNKELYQAYKQQLKETPRIHIKIENPELQDEMIQNIMVLLMSKYSPLDTTVGDVFQELAFLAHDMGIKKKE